MKPYILFLFIILASCNDGGSDPEFVEKSKGDTIVMHIIRKRDSLTLDSLKKASAYPYTVK